MARYSKSLQDLQADFLRVSDVYAARFSINRDELWSLAKISEEVGELTQAHLRLTGRARSDESAELLRQKLADEVADVLGMLLIYAKSQNIDVGEAVERNGCAISRLETP